MCGCGLGPEGHVLRDEEGPNMRPHGNPQFVLTRVLQAAHFEGNNIGVAAATPAARVPPPRPVLAPAPPPRLNSIVSPLRSQHLAWTPSFLRESVLFPRYRLLLP